MLVGRALSTVRAFRRRPRTVFARSLVLAALLAASSTVFAGGEEARALDCFVLDYVFVPAEAGDSLDFQPISNCGGNYISGTVVTTEVVPAPGWRLVAFTAGPSLVGTNTLQVTVDQDRTISLFMARELTSGIASPATTVAQGEWRYFVVDVPSGATDLQVAMTGTNDADLYTRHGALPLVGAPGPTTSDCRPFLGSSNELCQHPDPADGTWYVGVRGDSVAPADVVVTATMAPCYPVTIDSNPPGYTPGVSPEPNCPGGYIGGTEITVTPVESQASPFTHWLGSLNGNETQPLVITVNASGTITAAHALEVTEANPLANQFVPAASHRFFYVKPAAGKPTLKLYTDSQAPGGAVTVTGYPQADPLGTLCTSSELAPCAIPEVPAGDVWFRVDAQAESTLEVSVDHCVAFQVEGYPELGGEVAVDPPTNCESYYGYPGYYNEQTALATAVPANGFIFAGWSDVFANENPYNFALDGNDVFSTAHFAAPLTSGETLVISTSIAFRHYYYIDVPAHTASLELAIAGALDAGISFGEPFLTECVPLSGTPCVYEFPAEGRWWISADRLSGPNGTITVTLTPGAVCHQLLVMTVPGAGGTVTTDPPSDPDCPEGRYKEGSQVTLHAVANGGWAFASGLNGGITQDALITMTGPQELKANFGKDLQGGTASAMYTGIFPGEFRYAFVDVPPGTALLAPTVSPVNHGYDARLYPPGSNNECYFNEERPPFECAVSHPTPGRWWISSTPFLTSPSPASDAFTVSVTLSNELLCWSVTAASLPVEGAIGDPIVVTPPNCAGGKFIQGTPVTVYAADPGPNHESSMVSVNGSPSDIYGDHVTLTANQDLAITFHYASRLLPGLNSLSFPATPTNSYFVDIPPGVSSLSFAATGLDGQQLLVAGLPGCTMTAGPGTRTCEIPNPGEGRWLFIVNGVPPGPANVEITLSPAMAAVVSHIAPAYVFEGVAEPVEISVHGFGFDPGDTVWFEGVALPTQFQSSSLLTATIPVELLGFAQQTNNVWVAATEGGQLRDVQLTSNYVQFLVTRPSSDVDCSGSTTASDALLLMQMLAGFETSSLCYADVNGDHKNSLADIIRVRLEVAGLLDALPMPLLLP